MSGFIAEPAHQIAGRDFGADMLQWQLSGIHARELDLFPRQVDGPCLRVGLKVEMLQGESLLGGQDVPVPQAQLQIVWVDQFQPALNRYANPRQGREAFAPLPGRAAAGPAIDAPEPAGGASRLSP